MSTAPHAGIVLTPEERLARRRLILRDTVSLFTLFLITSVIFVLTFLLHRSFTAHETLLGLRWKARGQLALKQGRPAQAIDDLRSALAYIPSRDTEIDLATALAQAGRTQEAFAYFNTLRETAPGDGLINLQLARLAARQGNQALAVRRYQSALDGTWQSRGYERRRAVRLEMAGYLISQNQYAKARAQLLIASSNVPSDDFPVQLRVAAMLEQAQDLPDALNLYRTMAAQRNAPVAALAGAGRAAYNLGMYRVAAGYLSREMAHPDAASLSPAARSADEALLDTSQRVLILFPSGNLPARARAERILGDKKIAAARLASCAGTTGTPAPPLAAILARWKLLPPRLTISTLEQHPALNQTLVQLIYDTETVTAQVCGPPTGDDALLLRIALDPSAVEQN